MATINYKEKYEKAVHAAMLAKQDTESAVTIRILEEIFPELKESEDKRIRQKFIHLVKMSNEVGGFALHKWEADEMLAWLEEQAEHANFRNKIQIGDKVTRNRDGVLVNLSQLNRVAKVDEKQGEQNPNYNNKELKDIVIAELSKYNSNDLNAPWATDSTGLQYPLYFANLGAKWQEEQKPAWSEEDERHIDTITSLLEDRKKEQSDFGVEVLNKEIAWLKSIKDRYISQSKHEWSEEDALGDNIDDARVLDELI